MRGDTRRKLAYAVDGGHDVCLGRGGRRLGYGCGQAGGSRLELGGFLAAGLAGLQVGVEGLVFVVLECSEGVCGGEGVGVGGVVVHVVTPMQSRSRMSPSRMRVLIVGSGVRRASATSR